MKATRPPLVPPPQDPSTQRMNLDFSANFYDYLRRLRTFYRGATYEQIVENLVRYAAEKREHFVPADHEPFVDDSTEISEVRAKRRKPRLSKKENSGSAQLGTNQVSLPEKR